MRGLTLGGMLLIAGCPEAGAPAECATMCAHAESLYAACLTEWGLDWHAAGYEGGEDFASACATWGWEADLLERDAIRAERAQPGDLASACQVRAALYKDPLTTCDDWVAEPWSALPWSD